MIDIILHAATKAVIIAALVSQGLITETTDPQTQQVIDAPAPGVDFVPWAGSGQMMSKAPVLDAQGNVTTPATFAPGYFMQVRISANLAVTDAIANPVDGEQWSRSKIARAIKNAGTPGTISLNGCTVNYYGFNGLQLARFADVSACLTANGLPGSEWAGGNSP